MKELINYISLVHINNTTKLPAMYTMGYIIKVLPFTILTNDLFTLIVVCI